MIFLVQYLVQYVDVSSAAAATKPTAALAVTATLAIAAATLAFTPA